MKSWPVVISLLVSYLSAITILGLPGEMYNSKVNKRALIGQSAINTSKFRL